MNTHLRGCVCVYLAGNVWQCVCVCVGGGNYCIDRVWPRQFGATLSTAFPHVCDVCVCYYCSEREKNSKNIPTRLEKWLSCALYIYDISGVLYKHVSNQFTNCVRLSFRRRKKTTMNWHMLVVYDHDHHWRTVYMVYINNIEIWYFDVFFLCIWFRLRKSNLIETSSKRIQYIQYTLGAWKT